MLKKLLAAVFAATLMAGTAMGAEYVGSGTVWTPGLGSSLTTGGDTGFDSGTSATGKITGAVSVGHNVFIGNDSTGLAGLGGTVDMTFGSLATSADKKITIEAGSSLKITGNVNLSTALTTDGIINSGTLEIGGNFTDGGSSKLTNTGGVLTLKGAGAAALGAAIGTGGATGIGTINLNGVVTAFDTTGATAVAGTDVVTIANQAAAVNGAVKVGVADLNLNGGEYKGAIVAKNLNAKTGITTLSQPTGFAVDAVAIDSGATLKINADFDLTGDEITNGEGAKIEVVKGKELKVAVDNYTGGGTINNLNSVVGTDKSVIISDGTNTAIDATLANAVLADLARGNGDIGLVATAGKELGGDISVAATGGQLDLKVLQTTNTVSVNVGGADLQISGTGTNKFNDVTAANIKSATGALAEYNGAVKGNLDIGDTATFKDGSSFSGGDVKIAGTKSMVVEAGSTVSVDDGKKLDFGATGFISNTGGELTIASTDIKNAGANVLRINDAATPTTAVTNLNSDKAAELLKYTQAGGPIGTINVRGDAGVGAVTLAGAAAGDAVNFYVDQTKNTAAVNLGAADATFFGGKSEYTVGFTANSITVKNGASNYQGGAVAANKVNVENGGTIGASGNVAFTSGTAEDFVVANGGTLDTTNGSVAVNGYTNVNFDGKLIAGMTAGGVANTVNTGASANTNIGPNSSIEFSTAFGTGVKAGDNATTNNTIIDTGLSTVDGLSSQNLNNLFGQFGLVYETDTSSANYGKLYVATAQNQLVGDGSLDDRGKGLFNLKTNWLPYGADGAIDYTLANAVYDSVIPAPNGSLVYDNNYFGNNAKELLDAVAHTRYNLANEGVIKSVFRNGNVGEMLMSGFSEIRGITSAIGARNVQLRSQLVGAGDVYYEYANPTLLLNNDYANRIWAGYLGNWDKGDRRDNVAGYDYDSHGFIVGYDRLVGCNFAFGGAFAYTRGNFEDAAAISDNTKIDNYSFNGYATYTAGNGFFANLQGGYTHSKNDIDARYNNSVSGIMNSDYNSDFWHIGGQFGYDFQPMDNLVITPSIGLQYIHGKAKSHWNSLGAVDSAKLKALFLPVEIAARYNIDFSNCSRLTLEGNVGYSYNFEKDGAGANMVLAGAGYANGNPVIIDGFAREQSRHTFNVGAGARYHFNRFDVGVKYDYYLQQDAHSHRVMGSVGVSF